MASVALPWLVTSCAVNGIGTVAAYATLADEAVVIDIYSIGAHLRTRSDDAGCAFGLGRRAYVFDASQAEEVSPGWYLLAAPLPEHASATKYYTQLGLDIYREGGFVGVAVGLRSGAAIARIPADQTAFVAVDYEPAAPERARVRSCLGEAQCAAFFSRP